MIRCISQDNINREKWDDCILRSVNGTIYALSAYLDQMVENWCALVEENYEAVMPLPFGKKYGIQYIFPPAFTQQLGIFSAGHLSEKRIAGFIAAIPKSFRYAEINFNSANGLIQESTTRRNYLLDISSSYEKIRKGYSRSAARNITKAQSQDIRIVENVAVGEIIRLHRDRFRDMIGASPKDYGNFFSLTEKLAKENAVVTAGALNNKDNLIAGSIFFLFKNKVYFIFNGNAAAGLQTGATHLLMDSVIRKFCAQNITIDFEGSDTPEFARFYEQFGAIAEKYSFLKINRLPLLLKWLK